MGRYLIRRLIQSFFTLAAISIVIFGILSLAPGDPLGEFATNPNISPTLQAQIRESYGLDEPVHVQYISWAREWVTGNWGRSFGGAGDVRDYVFGRVPVTLAVIGSSFLVGLLIAIPIGVLSAVKQYSAFDQLATTFAFLGFSIPTFFSGIVLIYIFSVRLLDTPFALPFVFNSQVDDVWGNVKQAILPVAVLAMFNAAGLMRFVRASMLETLNQDYVRTARAKGLRERLVIVAHAMRNALIPVVTIIALRLPGVFGGAIITETIFRIPGIGSALITAINNSDTPVVMSITFAVAVLVVLFNIVADVLYAFLDPRIAYD
ncbi:MAG: ABC transporter permease [Chloroflexia bacterium]|nr:ABC transporter permease [Chloroflexia bacterium]MDQ3513802.1 ABC transporter permease [Chloroflexota bacterium]